MTVRDPCSSIYWRTNATNPWAPPSRQAGVKHLLSCLMNKVDLVDDEELLELAEMEIRDLLSEYDFRWAIFQLSMSGLLKPLKVILNTKTSSWTWRTLLTNTSQNQNVTLTNHCCFQSETYSQSLVVVQLLQTYRPWCCSCQWRSWNRWSKEEYPKSSCYWCWNVPQTTLTKVLPRQIRVLRGIQRDEIERGQHWLHLVQSTQYTKFKGEVYILSKEEYFSLHSSVNHRPQFYFRTTDGNRFNRTSWYWNGYAWW